MGRLGDCSVTSGPPPGHPQPPRGLTLRKAAVVFTLALLVSAAFCWLWYRNRSAELGHQLAMKSETLRRVGQLEEVVGSVAELPGQLLELKLLEERSLNAGETGRLLVRIDAAARGRVNVGTIGLSPEPTP